LEQDKSEVPSGKAMIWNVVDTPTIPAKKTTAAKTNEVAQAHQQRTFQEKRIKG